MRLLWGLHRSVSTVQQQRFAAKLPAMSGSPRRNETLALGAVGLLLGLLAAAGYGAWRAVSEDGVSSGDRWSAFGDAMLFPGSLVVVTVIVMVWLGWKANIDG
jgi:hypothetical protein